MGTQVPGLEQSGAASNPLVDQEKAFQRRKCLRATLEDHLGSVREGKEHSK